MQLQNRSMRAQPAAGCRASSSRRSAAAAPRPCAAGHSKRAVAVNNNWKVFGPTAEYSDGDAEYFRLTSQLSDQYEWFAPGQQQEEEASASPDTEEQQQKQQQRVIRPEFGMSPREIAALGLSGSQRNTPDPVRRV